MFVEDVRLDEVVEDVTVMDVGHMMIDGHPLRQEIDS